MEDQLKFSTVILLGLILSHSALSSSIVSDFQFEMAEDCEEVEFVEQKSLLVPIEELDPNNPPSGVITTSGEFFAIKPIGIYSGTVLPFPKPVPNPGGVGTGGNGGPGRSSKESIYENGIYAGTVLPFPKPVPKPGGSGGGGGGPASVFTGLFNDNGAFSDSDLPPLMEYNKVIYFCNLRNEFKIL